MTYLDVDQFLVIGIVASRSVERFERRVCEDAETTDLRVVHRGADVAVLVLTVKDQTCQNMIPESFSDVR